MQTFDTHEYIKELQNAEVPLKQAEAHSNALKRVFGLDEIATKQDLRELKTEVGKDLNALETRVNGKMENLETRLNTKIETLEASLNTKMENLETRVNVKMENLEARLNTKIDTAIIALIKWLVPLLLGQTALIVTLIKFFDSSPAVH